MDILFLFFAFCTGLIVAIGAAPILIYRFKIWKFGQFVRLEGPEAHLAKQGTPTFGGLIFLLALLIGYLVFGLYGSNFNIVIFSTFGFGIIGFLDDYIKVIKKNNDGLKAKQKVLGILLVSLTLFVLFRYNINLTIPFTGIYITNTAILFLLFLFFTTATTNAVNLTDGVDGLSASVTVVVTMFFTILSVVKGLPELAMINAIFSGALIGYLFYNWYPAKVMMGDTGSLAMGGFVIANAFCLDIVWWLWIFGFVYVFETLSVILQVASYKIRKKRIFKMSPFHHHLELSGWKEVKIVLFSVGLTILLCGITLVFLI